jgi:hypothetical protein
MWGTVNEVLKPVCEKGGDVNVCGVIVIVLRELLCGPTGGTALVAPRMAAIVKSVRYILQYEVVS